MINVDKAVTVTKGESASTVFLAKGTTKPKIEPKKKPKKKTTKKG